MDSVDSVHGLSGHCPWTQWILSMDSVDNVHGLSGHCPWTFIPILQPDNVHGQCPLSPWTFYRRDDTSTVYNNSLHYSCAHHVYVLVSLHVPLGAIGGL